MMPVSVVDTADKSSSDMKAYDESIWRVCGVARVSAIACVAARMCDRICGTVRVHAPARARARLRACETRVRAQGSPHPPWAHTRPGSCPCQYMKRCSRPYLTNRDWQVEPTQICRCTMTQNTAGFSWGMQAQTARRCRRHDVQSTHKSSVRVPTATHHAGLGSTAAAAASATRI